VTYVFHLCSWKFAMTAAEHLMTNANDNAKRRRGSPGPEGGGVGRDGCVLGMVADLRRWVASDFPQFLPPAHVDPEAALRELLDLLIKAAPDDLRAAAFMRLEAIDEGFLLTDREKAMANFYDDEVQLAFVRHRESVPV